MESRKELTILWLDDYSRYNSWGKTNPTIYNLKCKLGFSLRIIFEKDLDSNYPNSYKPPSEKFLQKIRELTGKSGEGQVDLVVIGNNLGIGVKKAEAIDVLRQDFTIIVYTIPNQKTLSLYEPMGFVNENICDRNDLGQRLMKLAMFYLI